MLHLGIRGGVAQQLLLSPLLKIPAARELCFNQSVLRSPEDGMLLDSAPGWLSGDGVIV
jgi:hypothetical protein